MALLSVAFILNAGRLMLDKIGTLLKAQYRAEKTGKIGTFLCRLAPNYMRFHLVEWSFVRRHKKEWGCRYVLASLIIAVSVMLTGVCVVAYTSYEYYRSIGNQPECIDHIDHVLGCGRRIHASQNILQYFPIYGYRYRD